MVRSTYSIFLSLALVCSVGGRAAESMDEVGKPGPAFKLTEIKADPKTDTAAASHYLAKIKLNADTTLDANSFYVGKDGGVYVTGDKALRPVSYDPKTKALTMGDTVIDQTNPVNKKFMRDLGWVLLRDSKSEQAKTVLRDLYAIDVDALAGGPGEGDGGTGLNFDHLGSGSNLFKGGLKGASGRPFAASRSALAQLSSLIMEPEAWDGACGTPDKPCVYTNKKTGEVVLVTPEMKQKHALETLTPPVEVNPNKEFEKAKLAAQTKDALNERAKALPADVKEFKLYIGAEWCGPCQGKKSSMLSGSMKIPTLISWDPLARNDSELLKYAFSKGNHTIPALVTVLRKADGSVDWEAMERAANTVKNTFEDLNP